MEGGGGDAVVCHNSKGELISAQLFDLFEGLALYGENPVESAESFQLQAKEIAQVLSSVSSNDFFVRETERIIENFRLLPKDTTLNPVHDSNSIIKPANCDLFQAALYDSSGRVFVDSRIWELLSETHRAALISHEVIYAYFRLSEMAKTSRRARRYVSYLYSGKSLAPKPKWSGSSPSESCLSEEIDMYTGNPRAAFRTTLLPDGRWQVVFDFFMGFSTIGSTILISNPPAGYSWPIAEHDAKGGSPGGPGVGLDLDLKADIDEGWRVVSWYLDQDSSLNYVTLETHEWTRKIYFKCTSWNHEKEHIAKDL